MVNTSVLKNLLSDDASLSTYMQGNIVPLNDIKTRLLLSERLRTSNIPDHHYRLALENDCNEFVNLDELLVKGIFKLANRYLYVQGIVHVRHEKQNEWQQLVTFIPPLLLQMSLLHEKSTLVGKDIKTVQDYYVNTILPNAKYTALPYPDLPELESLLLSQKGLHDLHVHLSGSTETDIVWQFFLSAPDKAYKDLEEVFFTQPKVKEQLEQESHLLDPYQFYRLLKTARKIRQVLYEFIFPNSTNDAGSRSLSSLLEQVALWDEKNFSSYNFKHPFGKLLYSIPDVPNDLGVEGLMYVLVFRELSMNKDQALASLFHFYLLILGLANRLLVHQLHQYGFEQFQKHTLNRLREQSEKKYHDRFFQMHGNQLRNLKFLEGRFSPKQTQLENIVMLDNIQQGWKELNKGILVANNPSKLRSDLIDIPVPELKLIAHFIKRKEVIRDRFIRHKEFRADIWQRGKVLSILAESKRYSKDIVGIDAAASEFDTPPEVFAPIFRKFAKIKDFHFTYHVGEDFFHILSGLRAIYEAVEFMDFRKGDRIGHATAAGISPDRWFSAMGPFLLIRRGDRLDDLIFVYNFIDQQKVRVASTVLKSIEIKIIDLSLSIYSKTFSIKDHVEAWLLRKYCPIHAFSSDLIAAKQTSVFDLNEWLGVRNSNASANALEIWKMYHSEKVRKKYDDIIEIDTQEFFDHGILSSIQLEVLKFLSQKGIIIETLPTSNVRIGHYPDFSSYHLWNWKEWKDQGNPIPDIVVGTDDTGIFATNILNEYANLFCHLITERKVPRASAMVFIQQLDKNSDLYRF